MRFMVMVKATAQSEAGKLPDEKILAAMAKFNEELVKAGVMLDGGGLQPSSKGARIKYSKGKTTIIDGPFAETKELVAGYWLIQAKSRAEAIEWIRRAPFDQDRTTGGEADVEIRQMFELEDFAPGDAIEHHRDVGRQLEQQKRQKK